MPRTAVATLGLALVLGSGLPLPGRLPGSPRSAHAAADPADIVAAERAFADQVRQRGVREGFLAWLARTSVVFRPGPVSGIATYEKQPPGWRGLLAWTPVHAGISADGLLGWSTGPWTWQTDTTRKQPDAHGEYMSVWRRQGDGSWKAVLDCGIGHPPPTREAPAVRYAPPAPGPGLGSRPLAARKTLYEADAGFARVAGASGVSDALARYGAEDVIVLREGAQRASGLQAARDSIGAREQRVAMVSNAQSVTGSGDLGYTYGTFVSGRATAPDSAWYVHVWRRGPTPAWKLAFQVVMPVSKKN